jgi:hypothetical protein
MAVIVMKNVFHTSLHISQKFDLKGSETHRLVTQEQIDAGVTVLKVTMLWYVFVISALSIYMWLMAIT